MAHIVRIQNSFEDTLQIAQGSNVLEICRIRDEAHITIALNDEHGEPISEAQIEPAQLCDYLRAQGLPLDAA